MPIVDIAERRRSLWGGGVVRSLYVTKGLADLSHREYIYSAMPLRSAGMPAMDVAQCSRCHAEDDRELFL